MNSQIKEDRAKRPELFHFNGAITTAQLNDWTQQRNFVVPDDLKEFWCETGGGEMFESETVLSPLGITASGDDVDSVNAYHRNKGMPPGYLIFHTGIGGLSAIRMPAGEYLSIHEGSYSVQQTFGSLADWYARLLRKEYAPRYGLE